MKTAIALTLAVLLASPLAVAPALAADTARASATLSIYDGPGDRYDVIGKLKKGTVVALNRCTRGDWCLFEDENGDPVGWVRASYLIGAGAILEARPHRFLVNPEFIPNP